MVKLKLNIKTCRDILQIFTFRKSVIGLPVILNVRPEIICGYR